MGLIFHHSILLTVGLRGAFQHIAVQQKVLNCQFHLMVSFHNGLSIFLQWLPGAFQICTAV